MKIKKLTALAMTTAMCAATIFGCGGSGDDKETTTAGSGAATQTTVNPADEEAIECAIKVWAPAEDRESGWLEQMTANFSKAHPNWKITFSYDTC